MNNLKRIETKLEIEWDRSVPVSELVRIYEPEFGRLWSKDVIGDIVYLSFVRAGGPIRMEKL